MRSGELCVLDSVTLDDATGLDKDVAFGRCEQHTTFRRAAILVLRYSPDARWLALVRAYSVLMSIVHAYAGVPLLKYLVCPCGACTAAR